MKTLAERLVWARTNRKISQEKLAELAGISQGSVGHLESGLRKSSRKITTIAEVLGVDAIWLAEGRGTHDQTSAPDRMTTELDQSILDVIDIMKATDERCRQKIRLAALDVVDMHNSQINRTRAVILDDDELRIIEKRRKASKLGRSLIDSAAESAIEDEQFIQSAYRA